MPSPRTVCARVLLIAATSGCGIETVTPEEEAALAELRLQALPPSPSNAFADDPRAAALGHQLFFDTRFSGPLTRESALGPFGASGRVACATCHDLGNGGADTRSERATSLGASWGTRNTQTVINAAYSPWMFWDGRTDALWTQALAAMENPGTHNNTRLQVAHTLYAHYRVPYEELFGAMPALEDAARFPAAGKPGTAAWTGMTAADRDAVTRVFVNFGKAIEAYERRLVDRSSPFDRFLGGDPLAMSPAAVRGARLFVGRAACNECHSGPALADNRFHNHGVPQAGARVPAEDRGRAAGITRLLQAEFTAAGPYSDQPRPPMSAEQLITDRDEGAFRTPSLRNVARTGPYMHTGALASLWDVLVFYNDAAGTDRFAGARAPASRVALGLGDGELADLVEFLRALDGDPLPPALIGAPALP